MASYEIPYMPLFVDLRSKPVVVIGGGAVAERKVEALIEAQAQVVVISPEITERLRELADQGRISWKQRRYERGDLAAACLAFCACGVTAVDALVAEEAADTGCLLNVVDVPELCTFIVPSVVKRGPLRIAVSTSGAAPTVAKQVRSDLESRYDASWGAYLNTLGEVRALVKERVAGDEATRKPIFEALADDGIRELFAQGRQVDAEELYARYVTPLLETQEGDRL